jgi:hypothetical protein
MGDLVLFLPSCLPDGDMVLLAGQVGIMVGATLTQDAALGEKLGEELGLTLILGLALGLLLALGAELGSGVGQEVADIPFTQGLKHASFSSSKISLASLYGVSSFRNVHIASI